MSASIKPDHTKKVISKVFIKFQLTQGQTNAEVFLKELILRQLDPDRLERSLVGKENFVPDQQRRRLLFDGEWNDDLAVEPHGPAEMLQITKRTNKPEHQCCYLDLIIIIACAEIVQHDYYAIFWLIRHPYFQNKFNMFFFVYNCTKMVTYTEFNEH